MSFTAGQDIVCTVTAQPKAKAAKDTIARLMRRDPSAIKAMRRAQKLRRQRMNIYTRGGRDWYSREKSSRVVRVEPGASWTMPFTPDIAPDLDSVRDWVECKAQA